jgi:NAD(P)-dependent dehydrogenase (short-subunit alcohol dehydrogenase family)
MSTTGRIAIVTGAAQGIGRRTAQLLAQRGYGLVLNDLRPATQTLKALRELGAAPIEVLGDVSDESVVGQIAAHAAALRPRRCAGE